MFDRNAAPIAPEAALTILAGADAAAIRAPAGAPLPALGTVDMLASGTGLVMLPMRDPVEGTAFHLGEVPVAEARIRLADHGAEGYGMILGRNPERSMAMGAIDAAAAAGLARKRIAGRDPGLRAARARGRGRRDDRRLPPSGRCRPSDRPRTSPAGEGARRCG